MTALTPLHIPVDHPAFAGHFPGMPIVPGVVLLDEALYAITISTGIPVAACFINSVKFLSPLKPGEAVVVAHEIQDNGSIVFEINCGTRKIVAGSITPHSTMPDLVKGNSAA
jgi:3-hydroxyacyl-[acyl-carrier-protein] dehydratase